MKQRFILLLGIVILAGTILACGGSDNTGTKTGTTDAGNTTNATPPKHFKVGDTVKVGSTWQAVVNSVKTDDGGQYSALKSGDVYLVVDMSLTNLSNQEQNVSSMLNFTLQDSTGQKYNQTIDTNAGASIDGKVSAGSPLRGSLAFEVPSSVKSFTLNFSPDVVASGQTTWDLSVS